MHSPVMPSHAWRACLLAAASVSASSSDAHVANSHVARSWVGTWGTATAGSPLASAQQLRLKATRDLLAQQTDRLVSAQRGAGVVRHGSDANGQPRDVLVSAGVRHVIVLLGIGDIGVPADPAVGIAQLIDLYRQLIARAHARGLAIYGGTMMPFGGAIKPGYDTPDKERVRQGANDWIRSSGQFDAVIDFDRTLRDPHQPSRMLPAYDSGDHLHPNDAGILAMASAIPLGLFVTPAKPRERGAMP